MTTTKYFRHAHGCGSGCTKSFIKLEEELDNSYKKVTIVLYSAWMGSYQKIHYIFEGEFLPIQEPFGLLRIEKATNMNTNEVTNTNFCFDAYFFNNEMSTEWFQHQDKIGIDLYMGGGCYSTSMFSVQIRLNDDIINSYGDLDKESIVKLVDGLKYGVCTEDDYTTLRKY